MIVLNTIYTLLKEQLKSVKGIKKIDWFNDQYNNMEDEKATRYPAVYIEINDPIQWRQSGDRFQHGTVTLRLHIVLYDINDSPVRCLEFAQKVFEQVNSKSLYDEDNFQWTTELVRQATTFPKRYNQLKVAQMDFVCEVFDVTNVPVRTDAGEVQFIVQTN